MGIFFVERHLGGDVPDRLTELLQKVRVAPARRTKLRSTDELSVLRVSI